jgi:hypothetical protein
VTADLIEGYLDQLITHLRGSATDVWNDCENDHLTGPGRLVDGGGHVGAAPLGE